MAGLKQQFFAWMMANAAESYEAAIAPRKMKLFEGVSGRVLELGPGAGPNLRYFDANIDYVGIEPNLYMQPYLTQEAEKCAVPISVQQTTLDKAGFEAASFDYVISTLVLCSVPNLEETLAQIYRVLKPNGQFLFVEHVAAPKGSLLRQVQDGVRPLWQWIGDGCQSNRDTGKALKDVGFSNLDYESFDGPIPIAIVRPHIAGVATK
ncbi:MAG: methyltransferase domain-containing protein [Acaryochloridaceae cyanobacterium RL_2_7]|nr:methyltransferase domain-containing protein [Acaryochloridaceae cyanobacterium RL_2_7]